MEVLEKIKNKEDKMKRTDRGVPEYGVRWRFGWMMVDRYLPLKVDIPLSIKK